LFGALAWPAATLAIALIFRNDVTRALGRVGQFKYHDLEVTFHEDLRQAEELARSIPASPAKGPIVLEIDPGECPPLVGQFIHDTPPPMAPPEDREALVKIAASSPREAVERAWGIVERSLDRLAASLGDRRIANRSNPDAVTRFLVDRGRLGVPEALLVGLLQTLRGRAASLDDRSPSPDEARRFVDLALGVASRIVERG